jgi:hypothetical protein
MFQKGVVMKSSLQKTAVCIQWIARIVGGLLVLLVLVFLIGEGFPALASLSGAEIGMSACLAIMLVGLLLGWRHALAGGLLTMAGYAGFAIIDRSFNLDSPFILFLVAAALYLLTWALRRSITPQNRSVGGVS